MMTGRGGRLAGLVVLTFAASWLVAGPVRAAGPEFGRPTISGSFGEEIVATQPVTLDATPDLVEVLVTMGSATAPIVSEVPTPDDRTLTLRHPVVATGDHVLPNTPLRVRWRITTDGVARLGPETRTVVADERFDWQTVEGDVVRVHWYDGGREFGERALRIGEAAVADTSREFGVTEDEPIDFFIYATQDAFYDALGPGTRENVGGQANADIRTLFAQIAPSSIDDPWVENVVPHELIHLVFDTAVKNPYHFPPRWLNEGLAVYLSVGYDLSDRAAVETAARNGQLIPLDGLVGQFPTSATRFSLAYSESVSAVDYIIRTDGRDTMVDLVRSYAQGRTDDEAFEAAIGMDVAAFNDAWLADLGAAAPTTYGPQPAPPGPRPADWGAPPPPMSGATPQPPGGATTRPPTAVPDPASGTPPTGRLLLIVLAPLVVLGIVLLVFTRTRRPAEDPRWPR